MDSFEIREACPADLPTLLQFEQGVIAAERPYNTTVKPDPVHYYDLEAMMTSSTIHLVVAVKDQQVVGSGYARIETAKHYYKYSRHAYLGFMYVHPPFRGMGINMLVVNALESWATKQGVTEIVLDVFNENESAIKAYEKAGFEKSLVQMRKGLTR